MLTIIRKTALNILPVLLVAVFLPSKVAAGDSALYTLESGFGELVYALSRSIVTVESLRSIKAPGAGISEEGVQSLISSGIIFDSSGHILVEATSVLGKDRINVRFENLVLDADLVGVDYQNGVAVLSVGQPIGIPVKMAREYGCAGRMILAIGNSHGLQAAPTLGFCAGSRSNGDIQFSASITSGNVGGGLFDLSGHLMGIITGSIGYRDFDRVGLAVPAHKLNAVAAHLLLKGDRKAGYAGITTTEIEIAPGIEITPPVLFASDLSQRHNVINRALLVDRVVPFSPADKAGIVTGDLIYGLDGRRLTSALELVSAVLQSRPGTNLKLNIVRGNRPVDIVLNVGQRDLTPERSPAISPQYGDARSARTDSLMRGIQTLKQMIRRLEQRLQDLE